MKIKSPQDFWAGLMFIVFGLFFLIVARDYQMGTAVRMGPGYFPTVLGGILAVLGAVVLLTSFTMSGPKVPK
ncbi:MAG: tripartite tricarboxylate transporter TctB family protein, partial [Xanthomonadales bacterium]|nr:tripartite tricarboxylate transporter TctB family protein [Xanthomonadales bacterium]HQX25981.1 tripartite tricarboxylate transporter TctB family protein [Pseudomonadota bacterium]